METNLDLNREEKCMSLVVWKGCDRQIQELVSEHNDSPISARNKLSRLFWTRRPE